MNILKVEGERGRFFEINLDDPLQRKYEMVRELRLSSKPREEVCAKYNYSRKTGNEYLRAWNEKRWEGLKDPKNKNISPDLETLLSKGFQTNYGGVFLLLSYLVNYGIDKLVCSRGVEKQKGISIL